MLKSVRIVVIFFCFMGFLFVRFRESELFYDPLNSFFKGYYQNAALPEMDMVKWYVDIALRYGLQMILSLLILGMTFMEKGIIKFAAMFYIIVFVFLLVVLVFLVNSYEIGDANGVFYARRFLIQPLLIFILLPAFFYYRKVNT